LNELDNVATVFDTVVNGEEIDIRDKKGNSEIIKALDDIPYGHKIALCDLKKGEQVTKYGYEIGIASIPIKKGQHVHVHNIESIRGRGDWDAKKHAEILKEMKN
jgi:altronate dehydratase small subunit